MLRMLPMRVFIFVVAVVVAAVWPAVADERRQDAYPMKPARTVVPAWQRADVVCVKFRDGLMVRAREGALTDLGTGALKEAAAALEQLKGARWERVHGLAEDQLDQYCKTAAANLGAPVADLNLYFHLFLAAGMDAGATIDVLNALTCVEMAQGVGARPALPLPPNFQPQQGYLRPTTGTSADTLWALPGGRGQGVRVCDLEYNWTAGHNDLPAVTRIGPVGTPLDPNHGTAVLGQMVSRDNGWGTIGACHGASPYFSHVYVNNFYNLSTAITRTFPTLRAGDVMLIEQQWEGPRWSGGFDQFGYVPSEWYRPHYDAIRVAIGLGIVVVAAAGNGSQNLDDAIYSTGNGGHWPFLAANDSGAIIVGAAASPPPNGSSAARSRLYYSNYGSTVDLQGWGEHIYTTGYGDLYMSEGQLRWYTADFGGTSGASPIVTSAAVQVQAIHKAVMGTVLTPAQMRGALRGTGLAQTGGQYPATQLIGPMPNARAAILSLLPGDDCNGNLLPDRVDVVAGTSLDWNHNLVPDECECLADFNADGNLDPDDLADFIVCFFVDVATPGSCAGVGGVGGADFNGDGFRNPDDLADYVTGYFSGCG